MMILLYSFGLLALLGGGIFCTILAYIMIADAFCVIKGRYAAVGGGIMMGCGAGACFACFLWLLDHSPL